MNLRKHTNLLVTSLVAITLGIGSIFTYFVFYADLKNTAINDLEKQQKQLALIAANEIERYFFDIQKRIETMALASEVRDAQRSEACNLQLQKLVQVNNLQLNNLGRVSKDGTFVCAVNRTIIGEPVSKYGDYFAKIANDPQHNPAMSRLILPSGSASPVVAVHVPVFDAKGEFNGTIGGAVYFDELQKQILAGTQVSKNSVVAIYDDNLDVLSNPDPLIRGKNLNSPEIKALYSPAGALEQLVEKIKQPTSEGVLEYSLRNEPRRAAYKSARVADKNWTVIVVVPLVDYEAVVGRGLAHNMFIGISTAFVIAGTTVAYLISRPKITKTPQKSNHGSH